MKKFKVEKSRSTLWRESRSSNVSLQSEIDDYAENSVAVSELSDPLADFIPCEGFGDSNTDVGNHQRLDVGLGLSNTVHFTDGFDSLVVNDSSVGASPIGEDCCDSIVGWRWLDDDDDVDCEFEDNLVHDLAAWSLKNNISLSATTGLLSILKPCLPFLPKSAHTLRNSLRHTLHLIQDVNGGEYCHLGLSNGLTQLLRQNQTIPKQMELQINVDGIPLFKSSSISLWPILCLVKNMPVKVPFVIGMFCGKEKPGSASEFLATFVEEACILLKDGLTVDQQTVRVKMHSFVCDALARAFIKGIKSPSGYSSCEKCTVGLYGERYGNKVIFPSINSPLRTDESFDAMADEEHHIRACPLRPLPVGYVT